MKRATEMTPQELAEALAAIKAGPTKPETVPSDRHARDMSKAEQQEWLREYRRRLGDL